MSITCPKCGYTRQPTDHAPDYECPKCGVIYAKVGLAPKPARPEPTQAQTPTAAPRPTPQGPPTQQGPATQQPRQVPRNLVFCADCARPISPRAKACPACGCPGYGAPDTDDTGVVIKDVEMDFVTLIKRMVMWGLASIPAVIIVSIIFALVMRILFVVLGIPTSVIKG
jgi:predicted nucleic-acid-binding Zn-ribbon protein